MRVALYHSDDTNHLEMRCPLKPPMRRMSTRSTDRRCGITLVDLIVVLILGLLASIVLAPTLYHASQTIFRTGCSFNLRNIGLALSSYESAHHETFPIGSAYQNQPASPWGTSWWVEILPHVSASDALSRWQQVASSGSFSTDTLNPNFKSVAARQWHIMNCPSSPLPIFNRPLEHVSVANRQSIAGAFAGIATPSYVAIAGSAPDQRRTARTSAETASDEPQGRNTRDGALGILSGSGAFPPNRAVRVAALRDGQQHTMLIGEQANWYFDRQYEPPVLYDLRSSWPGGAYLGARAPYSDLGTSAEGANGSGEAPCYNITTVRYRINDPVLQAGRIAQPRGMLPSRPTALPAVNTTSGPGHNQGLFSAHGGGVNVLFADGSVRFLSDSTDVAVLLRLATCDDGVFVDSAALK